MKKAIGLCMGMIGVAGLAFSAGAQTLLVANQHSQDLSLIDTATGRQVATVAVGGITGHEVAASPDGKTAYEPIYGNSGVAKPGNDGSTMSVIDLASRKVVHTVDFGHGVRPHCAVYDKNSGMLYVTTELDKTISIIDPKTLKIVGSVPTGQEQSHMLVLSADGAEDDCGDSGVGEHAADRDVERWEHGVYGGSDDASAGGDRYGYE